MAVGGRGGLLSGAAALVLLLSACGGGDAASPASTSTTTTTTASSATAPESAPRVKPARVRVPKIQADSTLVEVGLTKERVLEVPPVTAPMQAAWYKFSQVPGDPGPAIVLGHVDGDKKPGIFFRLKEIVVGDEVLIDRVDGVALKFTVTRTEQVPKDRFPEDAVYGSTDTAELRLITCGGAFDRAAHSYTHNVIVYARLAG